MKKLLLTATALACAATCTLAFAACGEDGADKTPEAGHTHTYADAWTYDDNYHWHGATCDHTEEISGKAAHDYTNGDCVCGKAKPAVKLTKEQWETAIENTLNANNYTFKLELSACIIEIKLDYAAKAIWLKSEYSGYPGKVEDMEGQENILVEQTDGGIVVYYRDAENEAWNNKPFTSHYYGETFDEIFAKIFGEHRTLISLVKNLYNEVIYGVVQDTYTVTYDDIKFVVSFQDGYVSTMKLYLQSENGEESLAEICTYSAFGTTSVTLPQ